MEFSIFLAKVMGLYFLVISLAALINKDRFIEIIADIMENPALQLVLGFNVLVIGILLIVSHNIWMSGWPVLITIISWIIFIKGILILAFPQLANLMTKPYLESGIVVFISVLINLLLGLILLYYGFFSYANPY